MNCWHCDRPAHGVCNFCGRALCRDHVKSMPSIVSVFVDDGVKKAIVVADTLWCGVCRPQDSAMEVESL